jgi:Zn-dependent M32 family carboxypeptidase
MGHSLSEEADKHEDKLIIDKKVQKLKEHWENVEDKSTVWRGKIDYLLEEWKRYVELREELVDWLRKAEMYLKKEENPYNYTVSDLDEQINKHKVYRVSESLIFLPP